MSFGVGAGDIVKASELAYKLWRACSTATSEFNELSRELSSIQILLRSLSDDAKNPMSLLCRRGAGRQEELMTMIENLNKALVEVERLIDKYKSLGLKKKRVFDRVKFASHDLNELRGTLAVHLDIISGFYSSLSSGSLAKIEQIVEDIYQEIISDRRPRTILSITSDPRDQSAWAALEEELISEGIPLDKVEENRTEIIAFLRSLMLQEPEGLTPSDSVSNDPIAHRQAVEELLILEKLRANDFYIDDEDALAVESEEALRWAAEKGHIDVIKYLLRMEVDINVKDNDESTALHYAVRAGQTETVEFLLQSDAKSDYLRNCMLRNDIPQTFIKSTVLMDAVEHGRIGTIKLLIAKQFSTGPAETGATTPLHIAASMNRYSAARLLLKAGADINARSSDDDGFTALQIAVKNGNIAMAQYLLDNGASAQIDWTDKRKKDTLLHEVLDGSFEESRKLSLCRMLVDANVSARAARPWNEHRAPLSIAIMKGLTTIVEYLISRGADPDVIDNSTSSPLMLAITSEAQPEDRLAMIKMLQKAGADMNTISWDREKYLIFGEIKMSALQKATSIRWLTIVKILIEAGADPNVCSTNGGTPLLTAAQYKLSSKSEVQFDIFKALIAAGADLTYAHPSRKNSLLHFASKAKNIDAVKFFASKGADINSHDTNGDTPLMSYLKSLGYSREESPGVSMIKVLVENGAKIDDRHPRTGAPILHRAARYCPAEILEQLLKLGASTNALDNLQANALHYAAQAQNSNNIAILLKAGVSPKQQVVVEEGKFYPIDIARHFEKKEKPMVDLLAPVSPTSSAKFWAHQWDPDTFTSSRP